MLSVEIIRNAVLKAIGHDSVRNRDAYRIASEELNITKEGGWYTVELCGKTVRLYCNTKNVFPKVYALLINNPIFRTIKDNRDSRLENPGLSYLTAAARINLQKAKNAIHDDGSVWQCPIDFDLVEYEDYTDFCTSAGGCIACWFREFPAYYSKSK